MDPLRVADLRLCLLDTKVQWTAGEGHVLGSCQPPYGLAQFFLVDTARRSYKPLEFDGRMDVFPIEASLSTDGSRLVFVDSAYRLWRVHTESLESQATHTLDLSSSFLGGGPIVDLFLSPKWSSDDRWIYFWRHARDPSGVSNFPLALERVNATDNTSRGVLDPAALSSALGISNYDNLTRIRLDRVQWELAPDGRAVALAAGRRGQPPGGLWLIPLPPQ